MRTRDANGSDPQIVLNDSRVRPALWWAADGRILFANRQDPASESSNNGICSIRVDERTGESIGQPQPVADGQGRIGGLSATSDGRRLVLWRVNTQPQAFIVELESGLQQLKAPRRLTLDANGNVAEAWTSDSKAVLFVSNRNGTWKLFKQAVDETTADVLVEGRSIFLPRLSADGSQVLYLSASRPNDNSFHVSLMRKSIAGGPPQSVLQEQGITNYQCARAPAKLCIFSKLVGDDLIFVSFDVEHGAGHEITRMTNGFANWTLSPDGTTLAIYLDHHRFRFLLLKTGAAQDVSVKDWSLWNGDWSFDNHSVFMPSVSSESKPVILDIYRTGKAKVILEGDANTTFTWLIQSPNGRYGVLEAEIPGENNVWMVEKF